jgi:hypothetical protein
VLTEEHRKFLFQPIDSTASAPNTAITTSKRFQFVLKEGSLNLIPSSATYNDQAEPQSILTRLTCGQLQAKLDRFTRSEAFELFVSLQVCPSLIIILLECTHSTAFKFLFSILYVSQLK